VCHIPPPGSRISIPWSAQLGSPHFSYFPRSIAPALILTTVLTGLLLPGRMLAVDANSVAAPAIAGTLATSPRQGAVETPTHTASHPLPANGCVSPAGICEVRTGFVDLTVSASFASAVNTKPTLSTGPITLGQFTSVTSTPMPASLTLPP